MCQRGRTLELAASDRRVCNGPSIGAPRRQKCNSSWLQDESGVSRDELAAALQEVAEGRIPKDRLALRELAREMIEWPYKDLSTDSRLSQLKDAGGR